MKMNINLVILCIGLLIIITGCQATVTEETPVIEDPVAVITRPETIITATYTAVPPTETQVPPTQTAVPPTDTPLPTNTATVTATPTATLTPSPSPSPTFTPIPTNTPLPTATATAVILPTLEPTKPPFKVYPDTLYAPYSEDAFIQHTSRFHETLTKLDEMFVTISFGEKGNCLIFGDLYKTWTEQMPVLEDVPEKYITLHAEYRSLIDQIVMHTGEIARVCRDGGGTVSEETDAAIRQYLEWAIPRSEQVVVEIYQLR